MLTGPELIAALVAAPEGTTEAERIRLAGYVYQRQGKESLNRGGFYKALAAADPTLSALAGRQGAAGRRQVLGYTTKVLAKGHAVIGAAYLRQLGAEPGERLNIAPIDGKIIIERVRV